MGKSLEEKYIDITYLIQNEFERNIAKYGDKIKCRKGCSQCCHQIFRITLLDSFVIRNYLQSLPPDRHNNLKRKAENYQKHFEGSKNFDEEFYLNRIPCPALGDEGECTIYEARPVICRRFGPPVYDYKNPQKLFSCELNFNEGEEIIDDELIPNQTKIGKKWDELKTEFNIEMNVKENASATIAEAIINS